MRTSLRHRLVKRQRFGVFLFTLMIVILEIILHRNYFFPCEKADYYVAEESFISLENNRNLQQQNTHYSNQINLSLRPFNPNELSHEQWLALGFSEKQTLAILKYKKVVGGKFLSKGQLKKCYVISDYKYRELQNFILLPEQHDWDFQKNSYPNFVVSTYAQKPNPFNPNTLSQEAWQELGFSEKQAEIILKYKQKLGGIFQTKKQLQACYVISEYKYKELEPYIILESTTQVSTTHETNLTEEIIYKPFNPNDLNENDWLKLNFSEKQVHTIMNYKKYCGGKFTSTEQLSKCYAISSEKMEKLKPYIRWE